MGIGSTISAQEYRELLKQKGGAAKLLGQKKVKQSNDTARLEEITRRLSLATGSAGVTDEGLLQFSFDRAPLASLNILLGAHYMALSKYRNAWHHLVLEAYSKLGARKHIEGQVDIVVTRVAPRLLDIDNVIAKAAIDGLRYCGALRDDSPEYISSVKTAQEKGGEKVVLVVKPLA